MCYKCIVSDASTNLDWEESGKYKLPLEILRLKTWGRALEIVKAFRWSHHALMAFCVGNHRWIPRIKFQKSRKYFQIIMSHRALNYHGKFGANASHQNPQIMMTSCYRNFTQQWPCGRGIQWVPLMWDWTNCWTNRLVAADLRRRDVRVTCIASQPKIDMMWSRISIPEKYAYYLRVSAICCGLLSVDMLLI